MCADSCAKVHLISSTSFTVPRARKRHERRLGNLREFWPKEKEERENEMPERVVREAIACAEKSPTDDVVRSGIVARTSLKAVVFVVLTLPIPVRIWHEQLGFVEAALLRRRYAEFVEYWAYLCEEREFRKIQNSNMPPE